MSVQDTMYLFSSKVLRVQKSGSKPHVIQMMVCARNELGDDISFNPIPEESEANYSRLQMGSTKKLWKVRFAVVFLEII
jgi:hypothetical protein